MVMLTVVLWTYRGGLYIGQYGGRLVGMSLQLILLL